MSLLGGLLEGIGLVDGSGRRLAKAGQDSIKQGQKTAADSFYELKKYASDLRASGAFNASREIALNNERQQLSLETALRNTAAQSALVGYKPGDSRPTQSMNNLSQKNQLATRQQNIGIENSYRGQEQNLQQLLLQGGMNLANIQGQGGAQMAQIGSQLASQGGLGSLIGAAGLFGGGGGSRGASSPLSVIGGQTMPTLDTGNDLGDFARNLARAF